MQESSSDSEDTTTSSGSDSDSSSLSHEGNGEMRGKVTEKDPNYEKKKKCKCHGECKTRSCNCFKFGSGCNPSCSCDGTCVNIFNHLGYFFGESEKVDANPCFAKWLIENGNSESALKSVDREDLRKRILKCDRLIFIMFGLLIFDLKSKTNIFSYEELLEDDDFRKWKKDGKKISADQKLAHTQKLLRMLLSNDLDSQYFFSFCQDDVFNNDNAWHCITCKTCQEWKEWHCGHCDKCKYFSIFPNHAKHLLIF